MLTPVILSGGAGTRLWPLSRELYPKQLLALTGERTMLQQTASRLSGLAAASPVVVCNDAHRFLVAEQLRQLKMDTRAVVLEPFGRNTAPAIALAALAGLKMAAGEDPELLVLPADHVIRDVPMPETPEPSLEGVPAKAEWLVELSEEYGLDGPLNRLLAAIRA